MAWHKYGGGKELLAKLYDSIGANVVSFPYGPMPTQPLGWFKEPVSKAEDINGLKFRTVGISIDVFTGLGAAVNALPGGEIVAALDRGLLDAAEFNNASSDRVLGFPDVSKVCMLQSYHQNAEQFEILFNKTKYDALPEQMKAIITNAVEAASQDMSWKAIDRYSKDYSEMQTQGQRQVLQDAGGNSQETAGGLRRGREEEGGGKSAVQGDPAIAACLCPAGNAVGTGHGREPPPGLRSLLRTGGGSEEYLTPQFEPARRRRGNTERRLALPTDTPADRLPRMNVQHLLNTVDAISAWVGKAAAWLIIGLMTLVCVEVFKRYILNMPTAWIFDASNMFYGTLFMLAGAYALAQNAHVRGDFLYSSMRPRTQAALDLVLYVLFFLPGIAALVYAGYDYAALSWRIGEHSTVTAEGPPIYYFKSVIPLAGALVMLQGVAEIVRCIVCLRTGKWPSRRKDVEEIDVVEEQLAASEYVDEETRKAAIERAQKIDEQARQRGMGGDLQR